MKIALHSIMLSFPRKRNPALGETFLDARFRGHDNRRCCKRDGAIGEFRFRSLRAAHCFASRSSERSAGSHPTLSRQSRKRAGAGS